MDGHIRAKVTSQVNYSRSRPSSPSKDYGTSLSPPPLLRPKAKINSSATPIARKISGASSSPNIRAISPATTPTVPRAPSPFKYQHQSQRNEPPISPVVSQFRSKVTSTTRPKSVVGGSSSESRARALTTTPSDRHDPPTRERKRSGSVSSTLTAPVSIPLARGHSSSPSSSKLVLSTSGFENGTLSPSNVSGTLNGKSLVRVKSKISSITDGRSHSPSSLPPSPLLPSRPLSGQINRVARVSSITSIKSTPPLAPSPVVNSTTESEPTPPTSPTSALGHQYTPSSITKPHFFQSFHADNDNYTTYSAPNTSPSTHKVIIVDPATVPLPPQSPPTSTLSFSSRSSLSRSSASYNTRDNTDDSRSTAPPPHARVNGSINGIIVQSGSGRDSRFSSPSEGLGIKIMQAMADESFDEDYGSGGKEKSTDIEDTVLLDSKARAQAKSNRKIEDLEITNRSLLAINSSLEATKHRQAKEIRDLRRKLRESRLILPPQAYRAVKSSVDPEEFEAEDDESEEEEEERAVIEGKTDEAYRRVRSLLDRLLEQGREALESKPEDFAPGGKTGAKVLSEEEARPWRGEGADSHSMTSRESLSKRPLTPSKIAVPDDEDGLDNPDSEDEGEVSLLDIDDIPLANMSPNITVTLSPPP